MSEHDESCESVAVDIGVGEMHSPCGCLERKCERLTIEIAKLKKQLAAREAQIDKMARRLREQAALLKATTEDFRDMRGRFCEHHGTPGGVAPGCPSCRADKAESALLACQAREGELREALHRVC